MLSPIQKLLNILADLKVITVDQYISAQLKTPADSDLFDQIVK